MSVQSQNIAERLNITVSRLASFLTGNLGDKGFKERSFYGEAFLAGLLFQDNYSLAEKCLNWQIEKSRLSKEVAAHKEFHLYPFGKTASLPEYFTSTVFPISLKEKPTNWILLRTLCKVKNGNPLQSTIWQIVSLIVLTVNYKHGLLVDRRIGRVIKRDLSEEYLSHQYHSFMLAILIDIYESTGNKLYQHFFWKGLGYMTGQIENNGRIKPKGRGQEQLLGYASLIYSLAWAQKNRPKENYEQLLKATVDYTINFQKPDGSFPLVLKAGDDKSMWETYNNLFDYLPFTALMLKRAAQLCGTLK